MSHVCATQGFPVTVFLAVMLVGVNPDSTNARHSNFARWMLGLTAHFPYLADLAEFRRQAEWKFLHYGNQLRQQGYQLHEPEPAEFQWYVFTPVRRTLHVGVGVGVGAGAM